MDFKTIYRDLREQYPNAPAEFELMVRGVYEQILRPGDSAIDCGAHTGKHTLAMLASVMPGGHVYAFEALPAQVGLLRAKLSEADHEHVSLYNVALFSSCEDSTTFRIVDDRLGISSLRLRHGTDEQYRSRAIEIPQRTLDSFAEIAADDRIAFIKTDVEGAEYEVLRGAQQTIERNRPVVHFEFGSVAFEPFGTTWQDMYTFFETLDYVLMDMLGNTLGSEETFTSSVYAGGVYDYLAIPHESECEQPISELLVRWPFDR